jgi:hypothetical protein
MGEYMKHRLTFLIAFNLLFLQLEIIGCGNVNSEAGDDGSQDDDSGEGNDSSQDDDSSEGDDSVKQEFPAAGIGLTATGLKDGRVLIAGGVLLDPAGTISPNLVGELPQKSAYLFDPGTGAFRETEGQMNYERAYHTETLLEDGRVLLAGGEGIIDGLVRTRQDLEVFDPETETFTLVSGLMQEPRSGHTATLVDNGFVVLMGGRAITDASGVAGVYLRTADVFDPPSMKVTTILGDKGLLNQPRAWHTTTLLGNGRVIIIGGRNDIRAIGEVELLIVNTDNPPDSQIELLQGDGLTLEPARWAHTATYTLQKTQEFSSEPVVVIMGGYSSVPIGKYENDRETYETAVDAVNVFMLAIPPTGSIRSGCEKLPEPRARHTAVKLNNGEILVMGGRNITGDSLKTAYIYNPDGGCLTGSFRSTESMLAQSRYHHAAALMAEGFQVLIVGGRCYTSQSTDPLDDCQVARAAETLETYFSQ